MHRFTVFAKAHQADCGNSQPTTYIGAARDVYEEGALIFPAVQVQRDYRDIDDIIRMCRLRIRVPEQWWGDYLALVGAARIGERELLALGREVGWDALDEHAAAVVRLSRGAHGGGDPPPAARARRPRVSVHDPFPGTPPDGVPIKVTVDDRRRRADDRGRPARQPRLPAQRPEPHRGQRARPRR